jgi:hypothetical protein
VTFRVAEIDVREWRPQLFGRGNVRNVKDPLIEPLWDGERVLLVVGDPALGTAGPPTGSVGSAATDEMSVTAQGDPPVVFLDIDGEELEGPALDAIVADLRDAARADVLVLDGYLSRQPNTPPPNSMNRGVQMPTTQQMVGQMLFGRRSAKSPRAPTAAGHAETTDLGVPIAFVAIDLLAIDEQALLEIPLLERKRILDTAFDETRLLRRSPYVRPPVDSWLIAWRALGFHELAYKAANSHYMPGLQNEAWSRITIPLD